VFEIWVMNADGTNVQQLTDDSFPMDCVRLSVDADC
jgi:hypothetical protein